MTYVVDYLNSDKATRSAEVVIPALTQSGCGSDIVTVTACLKSKGLDVLKVKRITPKEQGK